MVSSVFRTCLVLLLIAGLVGSDVSMALAQEQGMSREERIQQHEARVREILERRRQEHAQREEPAARPAEPEAAAPAAPTEELLMGTVLLYTLFRVPDSDNERQLDIVARQHERLVTEVRIQNPRGVQMDRLRIALQFDKRFVKPVGILDSQVRPYLEGDPRFEIIDRDGIIYYDAKLDAARGLKDIPLIVVVWETLRPTEHTGINFVFASGETEAAPHTGIYQMGRNILGTPSDPFDGVLGSSLLIMPPFDPDRPNDQILQGKREELRDIYLAAVGAEDAEVGMRLIGPDRPISVGQEFDVDVQLFNPQGAILDALRFFIQFDPNVLQVVNRDQGNWIRRGVNVHDGPFRLDYPFDFHMQNEADNRRGIIQYHKGMARGRALPTGTFARIRFRAIAPIDTTEVELMAARQGSATLTAANNFGYNLLSRSPRFNMPLLSFPVYPEPLSTEEEIAASATPWMDPRYGTELLFAPPALRSSGPRATVTLDDAPDGE